ncbi:MAG: hypothetical protein IT379_32745 [Deltaproteobacteria bacterium]|nr:hypothetical protein [Deltaproteobacteria bacterium]
MTRRRRALVLLSVALVALATLVSIVAAQDVPTRRVGFAWQRGVPSASFAVRDLVDRNARQKLRSGLPQTLVVRVAAYAEGRTDPVGLTLRSCRVRYDLWEETYSVRILAPGVERTTSAGSVDDVIRLCLELRAIAIAGTYPRGRRISLLVIAELNPVSRDMLDRIRRWLARPAGGTLGEGDVVFGSFVSLFVNRRVGSAERMVRFRSQQEVVP